MTHREKEDLVAKIYHALYPQKNYWKSVDSNLRERYFAAIDDLIKQGVIVDG
jgi:hypothetical protein